MQDNITETLPAAQLPSITIDFEAYYDNSYTLKKLDGIRYVKDARFEGIGFSYQEEGQAAEWVSGPFEYLQLRLAELQLHRREVVAHHAMFDGSILEWIFHIKPLRYFCTMMAARPFVVPFRGSANLATCAEFFGFQSKGTYVAEAKGVHREEFGPVELAKYGVYCCNDCDLSSKLRDEIKPQLPRDEIDLIDLTIKKYLRGRLVLDKAVLLEEKEKAETREAKALLVLDALGLKRIDVTSNPRLAKHLRSRGIEPPMKISPATGLPTGAFSKKDPEFVVLRNHPNPEVQQLIECRLLLKSSIDRTRVEQFLDIERLCDTMPVPLLYYGAHTGRFSGMMGINMQNLPKGTNIRKALRAPPGYQVLVADLKQIEARITAVLAGEMSMIEAFTAGRDLYTEFASVLYGVPFDGVDEDQRFIGKICILGLGFGMGAAKFKLTVESLSIEMSNIRASEIVALYRKTYAKIPKLWRQLDAMIKKMSRLPPSESGWHGFPEGGALLKVFHEAVELPNGMRINYPGLGTSEKDPNHFSYNSPGLRGTNNRAFIWGGALCENIVQALARIIISRAEVRLARAGLVSVMQVHDELVYVVPEHTVPTVTGVLKRVLTDPVSWMPTLPLACSIGSGDTYGDSK